MHPDPKQPMAGLGRTQLNRRSRHEFVFVATGGRRRATSLFLSLGLCLASLVSQPLRAAEDGRRQFSIPGGDATRTLEIFSSQIGGPVVYLVNQVRGITTNPIRGTFTDREALEAMVVGTELRVMQDERSGALAVFREPAGSGAPSSAVASRSPSAGNSGSGEAGIPRRILGAIAGFLGGPFDRGDVPKNPNVPSSEEVFRLSPFEVVTDTDTGFRSANAGMGSRLALDLKDTPVPYSVINRALIDALGITDLREAASWATGQTWVSTDNGQDGFGTPQQYIARGNKINNQDSATNFGNQRNYYQNANFSSDSYAVERYDFGRGPNAALFGNPNGGQGGLGGISSVQTKRARFDGMLTTVNVEFGQWHFKRFTIDINRPLNERFSFRINAVDHQSRAWRRLDAVATRGLTVATTYLASDSTELRIEGSYEKRQNHIVGSGTDDVVSGWDGKTVFRGPITDEMISAADLPGVLSVPNSSYGPLQVLGPTTGITYNGEPNGIERRTAQTFAYNPYTNTIMNFRNAAYTRRADSTSRVPLWTKTAPNGAYFVRGEDLDGNSADRFGTAVPFGSGRSFHNRQAMPADQFDVAIANSRFKIPSPRFEMSVNTPAFVQQSKDLNLTLSQRLGPGLFLELGADINRNHNKTRSMDNQNNQGALGHRNGTIDLNMLLPNGLPNPNFLDVANQSNFTLSERWTVDRTFRVNLGWVRDFGALGNYAFNLNASIADRHSRQRNSALSMMQGNDPRLWGAGPNQVSLRTYWSDGVRAFTIPKRATFIDVDWTNPSVPVIAAPITFTPQWVLTGWNRSIVRSRYVILQTTARYLNNRLIFTGAFRRDMSVGNTRNSVAIGDLPASWDAITPVYRPDAPADYWSMTYIERDSSTGLPVSGKPRIAGNRPRTFVNGLLSPDPLYSGDRFRDDFNPPRSRVYGNTGQAGMVWHALSWISPYANYSSTFTPQTGVALDLNGDEHKPIEAYGYDLGASLSLVENRVNIKIDRFRNVRKNDDFPAPTTNPINLLYASNQAGDSDPSATGRNARGAADIPGFDYQRTENLGYELEVSADGMVPGLRLLLNGGVSYRMTTKRGPLTLAYVPAHARLFRQILEDAGGMLDTTARNPDSASAPGLAVINPAVTHSIDQSQAVDAYNNIWVQYDAIRALPDEKLYDTPTLNLFADYTLQRGMLRGLGLGAGVQWQGSTRYANLGNQTILDPSNPLPYAIDDPTVGPSNWLYLKGSYQSQASVHYRWERANGNILDLSLRINNPINDHDPIYGEANTPFGSSMRQPAGDLTKPNRVPVPDQVSRFPEPINFRLAISYTFGESGLALR